MDDARVDKLLWCLRVYKTRPQATDACDAGHVQIGPFEVRPGRKVHPGEVLIVRLPELTRTLRVDALPRSRLGSKQLPEFMTDLTPQQEYDRARQAALERSQARARFGSGRPTKKDRRDLSRLFDLE